MMSANGCTMEGKCEPVWAVSRGWCRIQLNECTRDRGSANVTQCGTSGAQEVSGLGSARVGRNLLANPSSKSPTLYGWSTRP